MICNLHTISFSSGTTGRLHSSSSYILTDHVISATKGISVIVMQDIPRPDSWNNHWNPLCSLSWILANPDERDFMENSEVPRVQEKDGKSQDDFVTAWWRPFTTRWSSVYYEQEECDIALIPRYFFFIHFNFSVIKMLLKMKVIRENCAIVYWGS